MAQREKTDPVAACLDADVLIAGLFSRRGASHAILLLGEIGLLQVVLPEAAVHEVRRNLTAKLPAAAPLFEEFLRALAVWIYHPTPRDHERARTLAHPKDVPIMAAAIGAGAHLLHAQRSPLPFGGRHPRRSPTGTPGGGPGMDGLVRAEGSRSLAGHLPAVSRRLQASTDDGEQQV